MNGEMPAKRRMKFMIDQASSKSEEIDLRPIARMEISLVSAVMFLEIAIRVE